MPEIEGIQIPAWLQKATSVRIPYVDKLTLTKQQESQSRDFAELTAEEKKSFCKYRKNPVPVQKLNTR